MSRGISITAIALMIFANLTSHSSAAERKDCSAMLDRCFQGCMSRGKTDAQIVTCGNHCQQVDYNNCIDSGGTPRSFSDARQSPTVGKTVGPPNSPVLNETQ